MAQTLTAKLLKLKETPIVDAARAGQVPELSRLVPVA